MPLIEFNEETKVLDMFRQAREWNAGTISMEGNDGAGNVTALLLVAVGETAAAFSKAIHEAEARWVEADERFAEAAEIEHAKFPSPVPDTDEGHHA